MKQIKFLLSLAIALMIVMPVLAQDADSDALKLSGAATVEYHFTNMSETVKDREPEEEKTGRIQGLTTDSGEVNVGFGVEKGNLTANVNLELQEADNVDVESLWFNYNFGPVQVKTDLSGSIVRYSDMDDRFGNAGDIGVEVSSSNEAGVGFFLSATDAGFAYANDSKVVLADGTEDTAAAHTVSVENRMLPVMGLGVTYVMQGDVAGETMDITSVTAGAYIDSPNKTDIGVNDVYAGKNMTNDDSSYTGYLVFLNAKQLLPVAQGMSIDLKVNYSQNMFGFLETRVNDQVQYDATNSLGGTKDNGTDSLIGVTLEAGVQATNELKIGVGGAYLLGQKGVDSKASSFGCIYNEALYNYDYYTALQALYASANAGTTAANEIEANKAKAKVDANVVGPQMWTNGNAMAYKAGGFVEYVLMEKTTFTLGGYYQYEELVWEATQADEDATAATNAAFQTAIGNFLKTLDPIEKGDDFKTVITTIDVTFNAEHAFDDNFALALDVEHKIKAETNSGKAYDKFADSTKSTLTSDDMVDAEKNTAETMVTVAAKYSF